jgi:hypothetical protein
MDTQTNPMDDRKRKEGSWAKPVDRLTVGAFPAEAINLNVDGRSITGPLQGFGQLWQKTYKVRLSGVNLSPAEVIKTWKENFGSFWPKGNRFYTPLTRIEPGEVALLNLNGPGGMPLSTGIIVVYADDESFTFMNPAGHMFAGMITFSAGEEENASYAQVQVLVRANDPLWEVSMRLFGFRKEDEFWHATLEALAAHFGVSGHVKQQATCVDSGLQWSQWKNIWHNAGIRTMFYAFTMPVRWLGRKIR